MDNHAIIKVQRSAEFEAALNRCQAEPKAQRYRRFVGAAFIAFGWILLFTCVFVGAWNAASVMEDWGSTGRSIGKVLVRVILGAIVFLPAIPFWYIGRKLAAPSARRQLERDPRPPVFYLRSFASDSDELTKQMIDGVLKKDMPRSTEENLVEQLRKVGPVIAVGKPEEPLPKLGAARLYVQDDVWQQVVAGIATDCALIVLRVGGTHGFWWEIEYAINRGKPEQILVWVSEDNGPKRRQIYESFRERANPLLPIPLPREFGQSRFIRFGRDWQPIVQSSFEPLESDPFYEPPPPPAPPRRGLIIKQLPILDVVVGTLLVFSLVLVGLVFAIYLFTGVW